MRKKTSILWTTPLNVFERAIKESTTIKEVIEKLDMSFSTSHYKTFNARIEHEDIDISHFNPTGNRKPPIEKIPLKDILVENSNYNRHLLKARLIEEGLLEEVCEFCGTGNEWRGKKLSLQLDHINGVNNDNRIENLRFLCPNCHSQTDTFGARNHKRVKSTSKCEKCCKEISKSKSGLCRKCYDTGSRKTERPSTETLLKDVSELGYVGTGEKYGVSDNAIRKWLKN